MPPKDGGNALDGECSAPESQQPMEQGEPLHDDGLIVVRDKPGLKSLEKFLLSRDRALPVVGLSPSQGSGKPLLTYEDLQAIIGRDVRVYFLSGPPFAVQLQRALTRKLAVPPGAARIWWPGLSKRSDPRDHPVVLSLEGENQDSMLVEFARQFDLSRPHVRREIKLIDGALAVAEQKLAEANEQQRGTAEQLRNEQIERHDALRVAAAAELRLTMTLQKLSGDSRVERATDTPSTTQRCKQK
jgi:hypothetical protein